MHSLGAVILKLCRQSVQPVLQRERASTADSLRQVLRGFICSDFSTVTVQNLFLQAFSPYPYPPCSHLDRPVHIWLGDAEVDESGHRQTHVEPVAEAEVVDELEDILHAQEDQTHQPLEAGQRTAANAGFYVVV